MLTEHFPTTSGLPLYGVDESLLTVDLKFDNHSTYLAFHVYAASWSTYTPIRYVHQGLELHNSRVNLVKLIIDDSVLSDGNYKIFV